MHRDRFRGRKSRSETGGPPLPGIKDKPGQTNFSDAAKKRYKAVKKAQQDAATLAKRRAAKASGVTGGGRRVFPGGTTPLDTFGVAIDKMLDTTKAEHDAARQIAIAASKGKITSQRGSFSGSVADRAAKAAAAALAEAKSYGYVSPRAKKPKRKSLGSGR